MTEAAIRSMTWEWCVMSDLMVVGYNGEMADMSNPRGEVVRERHFLIAESEQGHRFAARRLYETPERPQVFADKLNAEHVLPLDPRLDVTYPAYGSVAYQNGGQVAEVTWERRRDEEARL